MQQFATKGCKNAISIINDIEQSMCNQDKTEFGKTTPLSFIDRYNGSEKALVALSGQIAMNYILNKINNEMNVYKKETK